MLCSTCCLAASASKWGHLFGFLLCSRYTPQRGGLFTELLVHDNAFLRYSKLTDVFAIFKANTWPYSRFYSVSSREGRCGPGSPSAVKAPGLTLPVVALWGPAAETTRASLVREPAAAIRMAGTQASQLLAGRR